MQFSELVAATRSVRRFTGEPVAMADLEDLVKLARLTPSAANKQPLKYVLVADPGACAKVFSCLAWAAYMPQWPGPDEGQRPGGYVVICLDKDVSDTPVCDHGIVSQTMVLGAAEKGIAACILGSIAKEKLRDALDIPQTLDILLVVALGKAAETVVVDDLKPGPDGHKYWRDDDGVHHVPKRSVDEFIAARF